MKRFIGDRDMRVDSTTRLHEELIRLSNFYGARHEFARAGGGNASVKHDGILHIKPSGTTLADLSDRDLVPLRIDVLMEALKGDGATAGDPVMAAASAARVGAPDGRRPSVEILFHALIPDSLVLHLHPLVTNALTCSVRGPELASALLGEEAVWVDYIDPGVPLARGISIARRRHVESTGQSAPAVTLLGNHGVIVSGNSYDDVAERIDWLTGTIAAAIEQGEMSSSPTPELRVDLEAIAGAFQQATGTVSVASASDAFVRANVYLGAGPVSRGPLIPDQIVYSGSLPAILPEDPEAIRAAVAAHERAHGRPPIVGVVPSQAIVASGDSAKIAQNALDTFLDAVRVAHDAERLGGVRVMDHRERRFIETWEAEAYRQSVAASS